LKSKKVSYSVGDIDDVCFLFQSFRIVDTKSNGFFCHKSSNWLTFSVFLLALPLASVAILKLLTSLKHALYLWGMRTTIKKSNFYGGKRTVSGPSPKTKTKTSARQGRFTLFTRYNSLFPCRKCLLPMPYSSLPSRFFYVLLMGFNK